MTDTVAPDWLKLVIALIPLVAAALRAIPAFVTSSKARSRGRNSARTSLRVVTVNAAAPWEDVLWPEGWESSSNRRRFRRSEKVWIAVLFSVCFLAALCYALLAVDDLLDNFIPFHQGNGLPAVGASAIFLAICVVQARYWLTIRGDRGLGETLYGTDGSVKVIGDLIEVQQYCLGALYELGGKVVTCENISDQNGSRVSIVAATGLWPPKWLNTGPLKLVSIRGQKISVLVAALDDTMCDVSIHSDNTDPGVDESRKANRRNVRGFIDSWSYFPDQMGDTSG